MPDVNDLKLQAQVDLLNNLLDDGTLSPEKYRAKLLELGVDPVSIPSQPLNVTGDYVDRSTHGDTYHVDIKTVEQMIMPGEPSIDPVVLRQTYLRRLSEQAGRLPLTGIDPKAANGELQLSAVYTALLTQRREIEKTEAALGRLDEIDEPQRSEVADILADVETGPQDRLEIEITEITYKPGRRLSALEVLNQEKRLVLLGDPGSGKSTFVNFVALCLAGEALGLKDANLVLLTAMLPRDDGAQDNEESPQPWAHGAMLPVRIVLRDLAARGLPANHLPANGDTLWNFIVAELGATLKEYGPHLKRELLEQGGLILLDGLDEVPDAHQRRAQVKQVVQDFARSFPRCRVVVTSRTYAYQRQDWKLDSFAEAVLSPFTPSQIDRFVACWYTHIGAVRHLDEHDSQGRADLLRRAIRTNARLRELAERPLLLTLMASLHAWRGGSLPEKREELYADAVDLLLDQWESPKVVYDADGKLLRQPSLAEWLKIDRAVVRAELNRLAYEAQRDQPQLAGTADIDQGRLVSALLNVATNRDANPVHLVAYIRDRTGLLAARGEGVYTFPHRTFQEYLAACYQTDHGFPDDLASMARSDPNRWREVTLLAGAKASRGSAQAAWYLAEALCFREVAPVGVAPEADARGAWLAAQVLLENEGERLRLPSEKNKPKLERVRLWLRAIVECGWLPPLDRAQAGNALALLGDDRDFDELIVIPAGPFLMGSSDIDDTVSADEKPQHEITLPAFKIGKYPVTNMQYQRFIQATGREWGSDEGRKPEKANHPAADMTWHDACAYCDWLTSVWRADKKIAIDEAVRLPTEAEWEKAARDGFTSVSGEKRDGARVYPWGNEWDSNRCNSGEWGWNDTTAVGLFPTGASPYGCLDMVGNVWEWVSSLFGPLDRKTYRIDLQFPYPYEPTDGRENLEANDDFVRVLRGGSFITYRTHARCAYRSRFVPDARYEFSGFRVVVLRA